MMQIGIIKPVKIAAGLLLKIIVHPLHLPSSYCIKISGMHIYNIYGFVRFADEIVDTFHDYNKESLLQDFCNETYKAIETRISLNPILHSFQLTVNKYQLDLSLVDAFFCKHAMRS